MRALPVLAAALASLLACAALTGQAAAYTVDCVRLLEKYDRALLFFPDRARAERTVLPPAVSRAAQRARNAGCVSSDLDIIRLNAITAEFAGGRVRESGAPIRPISLQAGIVAGVTSEVEARLFFGGLGFRVRSQGAPGLGRRIFLGPFTTEGGLAEAAAIAERAGFVAPFPRRF